MDSEIKWPSWLVSSEGEGLSLRVKGYLTALIPVIIFVAQAAGHPLVEADLNNLVNALVLIVASAGAIIGAIMSITGWIRRNFNKRHGLGAFAKP